MAGLVGGIERWIIRLDSAQLFVVSDNMKVMIKGNMCVTMTCYINSGNVCILYGDRGGRVQYYANSQKYLKNINTILFPIQP